MVSDERAIENLLYIYAERIDLGDFDSVADLFTHGRISTSDGAATFKGRDEVLRMYTAAVIIDPDTGTPKTKHVTTNAIIDISADGTALARSYYTVFQATVGLSPQPVITGRYHDAFRQIDGTRWFDTRIILIDQTGDLTHHLRHNLS